MPRSALKKIAVQLDDHVWLLEYPKKNPNKIPIGGVVKHSDSVRVQVVDDEGKECWFRTPLTNVRLMHPTAVDGVDDLNNLGDLNEAGLLRNLFIRYQKSIIHTYIGPILVVVNPYKTLSIYGADSMQKYKSKKLGEMPPHIFALADNSYKHMLRSQKNHCIIVSGESGAGKTETSRYLLQYLSTIASQQPWIKEQIIAANLVLEAFGNAKTIKNDNSSRFGNFIDVKFNGHGMIQSIRIEQYLLEKSRLVYQIDGERNYHIFYYILAAMSNDKKQVLGLGKPADYVNLTQDNLNRSQSDACFAKGLASCLQCMGQEERHKLSDILHGMKVLLFTEAEISEIFGLLAGILHIGNFAFKETMIDNLDACEIIHTTGVKLTAQLFGVNEQVLMRTFTRRTLATREEFVTSPMNMDQANNVKNVFIKGIYAHLFVWVVDKVNKAISKEGKKKKRKQLPSIGVLDMFGFENFVDNSFDQLCINFVSENIQQFLVRHVFKLEQEEYYKESIEWEAVNFSDNHDLLNMVAVEPKNILALINEETLSTRGTDRTMLNKLIRCHGNNKLFGFPKSEHDNTFGIEHFSGHVRYNCKGFLQRNKDIFNSDLMDFIHISKNKFLKLLFFEELKSIASARRSNQNTLCEQFKKSMDTLMRTLSSYQPSFIRCIKPNELKQPNKFDRDLVADQLRYSGMLETIRMRKVGYPTRYSFREFISRYGVIVGRNQPIELKRDQIVACGKIISEALGPNTDFQIGKTKLFFKDLHNTLLEKKREDALTRWVVILQRAVKRWYCRHRYETLRKNVILIQASWRAYSARKKYLIMQQGYARLQAFWKSRRLTFRYTFARKRIIMFQVRCKGFLARRNMKLRLWAIVKIQTFIRGFLARQAFNKLKGSKKMKKLSKSQQKKLMLQMEKEQSELQNEANRKTSKMEKTREEEGDDESESDLSISQKKREEDISQYKFAKFVATYFQSSATYSHIKQQLKTPLLPNNNEGDRLAVLAVWTTLLRFMGDLSEPEYDKIPTENRVPVLYKIHENLGKSFSRNKKYLGEIQNNKSSRGKKHSMQNLLLASKKTSKVDGDVTKTSKERGETLKEAEIRVFINRPTTNLEKIHFIIENGILRSNIRNEIYCQICKQLSGNRNQTSRARGWILLALCAGCFAPNDAFMKYLLNFLRDGSNNYGLYCEKRLKRTLTNGARNQPPSWLELEATKSKNPIMLPITFMDATTKIFLADSATTAKELCNVLAEKIGLTDKFGFSLFIAVFDKVSSLGSGGDHVMDAISQAEKFVKEQGVQESNAPWRLFYRKEIFSPWHDSLTDKVSTNLIYQQVIRGVKSGEYICNSDTALAQLASKQCYVEYGSKIQASKMSALIPSYLPDRIMTTNKNMDYWLDLILNCHKEAVYTCERWEPSRVKADVVNKARISWPLLFSRFYEANQLTGMTLSKNDIVLAVNWTGIHLLDNSDNVLTELSFPEIMMVAANKSEKLQEASFTLSTVKGAKLTLTSSNADDITELIAYFIDGLKEKSQYAVALADMSDIDGTESKIIGMKKGDLIIMDQTAGDDFSSSGWRSGVNDRSGKSGNFPTDGVYILPTLKKPPTDLVALFCLSPGELQEHVRTFNNANAEDSDEKPYTLEGYAKGFFRTFSVQNTRGPSKRVKDKLYMKSREPIKQPLLKKLEDNRDVAQEATAAFLAIMKYMGDYPSKRLRQSNELTDEIFEGSLKHEQLKDEVYCQIMKQLTNNKQEYSEERGWELMWLATGLFAASTQLLPHLQKFLSSRKSNPVAHDCSARCQRSLHSGQRKYPPHLVEVEAIQHKTTQIFHKIYFPDDTDEAFEVESCTRAQDFCQNIANRLRLKTADGFSLFVKIADKVISVPANDFFFDFVRHLTDWLKRTRATKESATTQLTYQVFFLKKLWATTVPGKDMNADNIFHYYQEKPKYLRGFHKCSKEEAFQLAALIYRVKFGDDKSQFPNILRMLKELAPQYLLRLASPNDWKQQIVYHYNKSAARTKEEAKFHFLKIIHRWPTFGSAFFEVRQTTDSSYPENLLIAINKRGVSLIDVKSKEILSIFPFTKISNWSSGNTYFQMTVGSLVKGSKFLCETTLGYKMDDLLTSYINLLLSTMTEQKKRKL